MRDTIRLGLNKPWELAETLDRVFSVGLKSLNPFLKRKIMVKLEKTVIVFGVPVPRCQAIAKSGKQCGQPSVHGKQHCWNKEHHNFSAGKTVAKKRVRKPKPVAELKKEVVNTPPAKKMQKKTEPIKKTVAKKQAKKQDYSAIFTPEIKKEILVVWDKIILDFWKGMQTKHPISA